jgi:signal transduction histidine kinase
MSLKNKKTDQKQAKGDRRQVLRRTEDRVREQALSEGMRKQRSLLELGQLIGLDLKLDEMLMQIAQKACELMGADRCSIFLYEANTDELWSTVALGMGEQVIRIPSGTGIAGYCFGTRQTVNLEDAYTDPRFNREVDAHTGYRTRSLLCTPIYNRDGRTLGVIQLLNKKDGVFTKEDEIFLKTFGNHASVFIEMAQLQKARIDALEQSQKELERLNRVKTKALDHLSHELRTPLAVIKGNLLILKRKLKPQIAPVEGEKFFVALEKHLNRLLEIQQETDKIIRSYKEIEGGFLPDELEQFWRRLEDTSEIPPEIKAHWDTLKGWMTKSLSRKSGTIEFTPLFPFAEQVLKKIKQRAAHRDIHFYLEGPKGHCVSIDPRILEDVLEGLLKNAVENTPDEGMIRILLEQKDQRLLLKVQDFGIGITEENQKSIFDGLFHTQETELYTSKRPYDFNAGGKGLDLLRMKVYGQRFGFDLSLESRRCAHLPTDRDLCPGRISACHNCERPEHCFTSGGSIFYISFPIEGSKFFGRI